MSLVHGAPPRPRPPPRIGAGGARVLTDEQVLAEKERDFGRWVEGFVQEHGLQEMMAAPLDDALPPEKRAELERQSMRDDILHSTAAARAHARDGRERAEHERAAELQVEAKLADVAKANARLLGYTGPRHATVRHLTRAIEASCDALAASHAEAVSRHYSTALATASCDAHVETMQSLAGRLAAEHGEHVRLDLPSNAPPPRRRRSSGLLSSLQEGPRGSRHVALPRLR